MSVLCALVTKFLEDYIVDADVVVVVAAVALIFLEARFDTR